MKNVIIAASLLALISFAACNSSTTKTNENTTEQSVVNTATTQLYACSMHPEVTGKKGEKCSKCGMELTVAVKEKVKDTATVPVAATTETKTVPIAANANFSIADIVRNYIKMKNALTRDDAKAAADAGKAIVIAMAKLDVNTLDAAKKKAFTDVADDAKEHAEHIGDNAGKIEHQREHFVMLSKDVNDLVKTFGSTIKLYQDFCPMYNDGKGAIWISEIKEIKNPYFGTKMITCGSLKKEF
ncbi:MAG: DUF3347 domain-containing protein [Chitinophagaceae bacterium]